MSAGFEVLNNWADDYDLPGSDMQQARVKVIDAAKDLWMAHKSRDGRAHMASLTVLEYVERLIFIESTEVLEFIHDTG